MLGVGESSDAYHISAPDPEGKGAESAMRAALDDAGLGVEAICYINMHGTATPHNDAMESLAISRLFGTHVPCSSTKPLTGHMLGAAGASEAAFCWMMLQEAGKTVRLPPHCWDGERDESLPELRLAERGDEVVWATGQAVLSNSFAFGGSNCSVVLGGAS